MDKPLPEQNQAPGAGSPAQGASMALASIAKYPEVSACTAASAAWREKISPALHELDAIKSLAPGVAAPVAHVVGLLLEAMEVVGAYQDHILARMEHEKRLAQVVLNASEQLEELAKYQNKLLALRRTDRSRTLELIGMLRAEGLSQLDPNTLAPRLLEHLSQMKADDAALKAMTQENQARDQIRRIMRGAGIRMPKLSDSEGGAPAAPPAG